MLEEAIKVFDIQRIKGTTLYTIQPDEPLARAARITAEKDIGSLVVMEHGDLVVILTFRKVIVGNGGKIGQTQVRKAIDDHLLSCMLKTELDEVRRMMLDRNAAICR